MEFMWGIGCKEDREGLVRVVWCFDNYSIYLGIYFFEVELIIYMKYVV